MTRALQITPEVMAVLDTVTVDAQAARLPLKPILARPLYEKVDKVLNALGAKWSTKHKCHLFAPDVDGPSAFDAAMATRCVMRAADLGFFETPPEVLTALFDRADVRPGQRLLEPSAGLGAIAQGARDRGADVVCVEFEPGRRSALLAKGFVVDPTADFLKTTAKTLGLFDRVVMNPPFSLAGMAQADISHIRHAHAMLRPKGRLVTVASGGVAFRKNRATLDFHALIEQVGGTLTPLPEGAFKASGTNVNTVLVTLPAAS